MAPGIDEVLSHIASLDWNARIEEIRRVPERFGQAQQPEVYASIADHFYKQHLAAQFAYVQWADKYELAPLLEAYEQAVQSTDAFERVLPSELAQVLGSHPQTLRIFRLIVGYTTSEFAAAASEVSREIGGRGIGKGTIEGIEEGAVIPSSVAEACAEAIHRLVTGTMWDVASGDFKSKLHKPDTIEGWQTVQQFAAEGVPYGVLLHQRHYGGPFRTLLDATSTSRGDVLLEEPVESLFRTNGVPFVRTGSSNQQEIQARFNVTVSPSPDFVLYEGDRTLRAMLECKQANDGGTARDKAGRFANLRREGQRLGGVPVFAVLDGLGWQRTRDALGPVVRDTDGRVFTLDTLSELLSVNPMPDLIGKAR